MIDVKMKFDWDSHKDELNREKHGYSLQEGEDALARYPDFARDFENGRFRTVVPGSNNEMLFVVGETNTSLELTRIISVRDAEPHEIESMTISKLYFPVDE